MILYHNLYRNLSLGRFFLNVSFKILAKDTVFLKYLVTFVAQKHMEVFEGLKKMKMERLLCKKKTAEREHSWGKSAIFAPNEKH